MSGCIGASLQYRDGADPRRPPQRAPSDTGGSFFAYAGVSLAPSSVAASVPQTASMDVLRNHPATLTDNAAMSLLRDVRESSSGGSGALSGLTCAPGSCGRTRYAFSTN